MQHQVQRRGRILSTFCWLPILPCAASCSARANIKQVYAAAEPVRGGRGGRPPRVVHPHRGPHGPNTGRPTNPASRRPGAADDCCLICPVNFHSESSSASFPSAAPPSTSPCINTWICFPLLSLGPIVGPGTTAAAALRSPPPPPSSLASATDPVDPNSSSSSLAEDTDRHPAIGYQIEWNMKRKQRAE